MSDPGVSIGFVSPAGTEETRWVRLDQVGQAEQAVTFAEAADVIDSLYSASPCDNDGEAGTGGEAVDESSLPDEQDFLAAAASRLRITACEAAEWWPVEVDVLRSHREGAWRLVGDTVEIGETVVMTGRKTEAVELSGAVSYDLGYPYAGDLRIAGARVASVRGSTLNFVRPVTGWVRISYTAIWDRVTVRVPVTANAQGLYRAEPAAVICFWHRLAATLTLDQPEDDATLSVVRAVCPRYRFAHDGDCAETIEHYRRCNCSNKEAAGAWTETVSAVCPDGTAAGTWLGQRRVLDGYTDCPGEEDKFSNPDFYAEKCCEEPKGTLPRCEVERDRYQGGAEIEGGPQQYIDSYGPTVRLTAITPEGGDCGEIVRTWRYTPGWAASGGPQLPSLLYVTPGGFVRVTITGGRPPARGWHTATWDLSSDISGPERVQYVDNAVMLTVDDTFREGRVVVTDACGRRSNTLQLKTAQQWTWVGGYKFSTIDPDADKDCSSCDCIGCYPGAPYHFDAGFVVQVHREYPELWLGPEEAIIMYSRVTVLHSTVHYLVSSSEDEIIVVYFDCGEPGTYWGAEGYGDKLLHCAPATAVVEADIYGQLQNTPQGKSCYGMFKVNLHHGAFKILEWVTP